MAKQNAKHSKKVKNLVVICFLCAIVLSVSTYAWFIGMRTVNVASFDVEIASTEGLYLSMDGKSWTYSLDAKNAEAYSGNTNTWADTGLIPMSSVGDVDPDTSTMKLYEKGSLTATKGGYRLLASRVANYTSTTDEGFYSEGKGYVAFDLFIRNVSGEEYYTENNVLNEEAIYLNTDSAVKVATGGVENTGIENSIRVAFVQLGRVEGTTGLDEDDTTGVANITAITCDDVEEGDGQVQVTGICRDAQIWEPNDTAHVQNAINWYETSCEERDGDDNTADSYNVGTSCATVADEKAYETYAVSRELLIADYVDVYDGADYNGYDENTIDYETYSKASVTDEYKLVSYPYFTDTMKLKQGTERPEFMTLAPNSITKVRVYIYLEGQDIDNYDFAQLGKKISVNFGFTKERYYGEDVKYNDDDTATLPDYLVRTPEDTQTGA